MLPKPPANLDKQNRFTELDALRGIAALLVVLFHFTMDKPAYNAVFKLGTTGVDLFFILSGFVIFMSLNKTSGVRQFLINRVSRLYPVYWAAVSFTFIVIIIRKVVITGGLYGLKQLTIYYVANLTMFQSWMRVPDLDAQYWTLIIEMLFYISIAYIFRLGLIRYIIPIVLSAVAITLLLIYSIPYIYLKKVFFALPLLQFTPLFLAGITFYKIRFSDTPTLKYYFVIVLCLICQILLFNHTGRSRHYISQWEYGCMLGLYFALFALFVNGKLTFIVNPVTLFLGKISYALYLTHEYISIKVIIPVLTEKFHINFWLAAIGVALPVVILLAYALTFYIEKPYNGRLKAFLARKTLNEKSISQ